MNLRRLVCLLRRQHDWEETIGVTSYVIFGVIDPGWLVNVTRCRRCDVTKRDVTKREVRTAPGKGER